MRKQQDAKSNASSEVPDAPEAYREAICAQIWCRRDHVATAHADASIA